MLTVCDAIVAVTGKDPGKSIRGKYSTEIGAAKLLKRRKFDTVEDALAAAFTPVNRLQAQRGDVGTIEKNGVLAAGYVTEYGFAVKTERGLIFYPQTEIRSAFKVG